MSQSTVSLVLSGKSAGRISARTEEAVRRAAEELGYRPNAAARALRTGAARAVGLVVPDVTHPFFGKTMRGAQEAAWSAGYSVALVDVPLDRPLEAPLEALRAGPADGFLYFSVEPPERRPGGERIVACVDAFDAMTSDRSYRRAFSLPEACRRVDADAGRQFDPLVAAALIELVCP